MRGRTNIVQRLGATVNGDVITATAQENISAGDFVSYELDTQVKGFSYAGSFVNDSLRATQVFGNKVYDIYQNALYVLESLNGNLYYKSIYNDNKVFGFKVLDNTHIAVVTKTASDVRYYTIRILELSSGGFSEVSSVDFSFSSGSASDFPFLEKIGNYIYVIALNQISTSTTGSYNFIVTVFVFNCSDFENLSLVGSGSASSLKTSVMRLTRALFVDGYLFCFSEEKSSTSNSYKFYVRKFQVSINESNLVSVSFVFTKELSVEPNLIVPLASGSILFSSNSVSSKSSTLYPININVLNCSSCAVSVVLLEALGFKTTSNQINYQGWTGLSFSKLSDTEIAVSSLLRANLPASGEATYLECAVLEFNPLNANFSLKTNILNLDSVANFFTAYLYSFFVGSEYYFNKISQGRFEYFVVKRSGNILNVEVDKTKVKKYDGGIAIGFAKTGAVQGNEIQVYVPPQTQS